MSAILIIGIRRHLGLGSNGSYYPEGDAGPITSQSALNQLHAAFTYSSGFELIRTIA